MNKLNLQIELLEVEQMSISEMRQKDGGLWFALQPPSDDKSKQSPKPEYAYNLHL